MTRSPGFASRLALLVYPALVATLFGCGDSVSQSGVGAGGGGAGGSGAGTTTTTGAGGGAGGTGTGGAPDCSAYELPGNDALDVTLRVVNQTAAPIYIPTPSACGYSNTLSIVDAQGHTSTLLEPGTGCGNSCALFLDPSDCICEVTPVCNGEAVRVEVGATYDSLWSGLVDESTTMPTECMSPGCSSSGPVQCQWSIAPTGDVTITASAWTELDCSGGCVCDPNHPEACVVSGVVGGSKIAATVTLAQVAPGTVELVFE